jgi:hypothetical protein
VIRERHHPTTATPTGSTTCSPTTSDGDHGSVDGNTSAGNSADDKCHSSLAELQV